MTHYLNVVNIQVVSQNGKRRRGNSDDSEIIIILIDFGLFFYSIGSFATMGK